MTSKTPPPPGTVLRYSYLWKREAAEGRIEGVKDRPVALLVALAARDGECVVLPITHAPPLDPDGAIEIPQRERTLIGLDDEPAWIVLTGYDSFLWPGFDLRPVPASRPPCVLYGTISRGLYGQVVSRAKALLRARRVSGVSRT